MDTKAKVATNYSEREEEIILDTSDQEEIPQEKEDEEMKQTKEPAKEGDTKVPDSLTQYKEEEAKKDESGSSVADQGKGLLQIEDIQIPNDPYLQATMKETEVDFNDYAQNFFFHTSLLLQESQKSQINLFKKLQTIFKAQVKVINN